MQKHCKPQSYLSGTHAKPQGSFGIDSGCTYGHYSIPWEIIAAKHDKLAAASDDSKQGYTVNRQQTK